MRFKILSLLLVSFAAAHAQVRPIIPVVKNTPAIQANEEWIDIGDNTPHFILASRSILTEDQRLSMNDQTVRPAMSETARKTGILAVTSTACDTLQTTLTGTNGNDGIMFDIDAFHWLTITQLAAHINPNSDSGYVKIYYKMGSYVGSDSIQYAAAWTFIDSAMVTSAGSGVATLIPINVNVTVPAGGAVAFYITGTGNTTITYSNGTLEGGVHVADTMMQVRQGIGKAYPFAGHYSPRIFNGEIFYCEAPVGVEEANASTNSISIQPNPFGENAVLSFGSAVSRAEVRIYDILGKEVKMMTAANTDKITISREGMKSGIYFISVSENGKQAAVKRMIIE